MDMFNDILAVGLKNGSIEVLDTKDGFKSQNLIKSHNDGEVWGLVHVDDEKSGKKFLVTSADDNRIIAYDAATKKCVAEGIVHPNTGKKKKKVSKSKTGGASSMSTQPHECQSRCIEYLHNGPKGMHHLAVANNMGQVTIRKVDWEKVAKGEKGCLDDVTRELFTKTAENAWIEVMKYSPKGDFLAIGTHHQRIFIFSI